MQNNSERNVGDDLRGSLFGRIITFKPLQKPIHSFESRIFECIICSLIVSSSKIEANDGKLKWLESKLSVQFPWQCASHNHFMLRTE
jgi:hypothetical protein